MTPNVNSYQLKWFGEISPTGPSWQTKKPGANPSCWQVSSGNSQDPHNPTPQRITPSKDS
jgi:hypothetical protein